MDEKSKYWFEVYNCLDATFKSLSNEKLASSLPNILQCIIKSPLLRHLECLTCETTDTKSPFTCWLLQGLLSATAFQRSQTLRNISLQLQSLILKATYDTDLTSFNELSILFLQTVNEIAKIKKFPTRKQFLFNVPTFIGNNVTVVPSDCIFNNKADQNYLLIFLFEVLYSVKHLLKDHSFFRHQDLWEIFNVVFKIQNEDVRLAALPILHLMVRNTSIPTHNKVVSNIQGNLINLLESERFDEQFELQNQIKEIWNSLYEVDESCKEMFVQKFLQNENDYPMKDFVHGEISNILKSFMDFVEVIRLLEISEVQSLSIKIKFLQKWIIKDIEKYLTDNETLTMAVHTHVQKKTWKVLSVHDMSFSWRHLWPDLMSYITNDLEWNEDKLFELTDIVKVLSSVLHCLNESHQLVKYNITLSFFGDDYKTIAASVCKNVKPSSQYLFKMACVFFTFFLNLCECKQLDLEFLCSKLIPYICTPWSNRGVQPMDDMLFEDFTMKENSIKCLRSLHCVPDKTFALIFKELAVTGKKNKSLAIEAVRSVPYLYLNGEQSPSKLISNILHPALLSDCYEVTVDLIDVLVDFVCTLSGGGFQFRDSDGNISIKCCECFDICEPFGSSACIPLVEPHLMKFLEVLVKCQDETVTKKFISILPRLAMHMTDLRKPEFLKILLQFAEHENADIRYLFAKVLTSIIFGRKWVVRSKNEGISDDLIFQCDSNRAIKTALDISFEVLEQLIQKSLMSASQCKHLQFSLLKTLVNLACFPVDAVLKPSLYLLLNYVGHPRSLVAPLLLQISAAHHTTPLVLYHLYKPELGFIMTMLIMLNYQRYNHSVQFTIAEIVSSFKGLLHKVFLEASGRFIIPLLVERIANDQRLSIFLEEWAEYAHKPLSSVLDEYFEHIYVHIVLTQSEEIIKKTINYLEKITKRKLSEMIRCCQQRVINKLLFNYHCKPEKVLQYLKDVITDCTPPQNIKENISEHLQSRFVPFLLHIVSKFVKDNSPELHKIHGVESLGAVIELMGTKNVTSVARKVLATLQAALSFDKTEYLHLHCQTWFAFVKMLEASELGPLLSTIISTLLPIFVRVPNNVAKIFDYIIVEREAQVREYLSAVIFVPKHESIQGVCSVLEKYTVKPNESLKDRLVREINLASHESVNVRIHGLKALKVTLNNFSCDIYNLASSSDGLESSIILLIQTLISCCNDQDQNISVEAASCLGHLGAIDPGLLPRKQKSAAHEDPPLTVHDPQFAFLAISELSRGFQNARSSIDMDTFALGIQELLKIYNYKDFWDKFESQIQNLISPMLSTSYKALIPTRKSWPDVIFGSKEASTHMEWASVWASKLIALGKDDKAVSVFRVCEPGFKRDSKVLQFLLQYIVLQVVLEDLSHHKVIKQEMDTVINWSSDGKLNDPVERDYPLRLMDYCGYPNFKQTINAAEVKSCAMIVFMLLDFLHFWLRTYRSKHCSQNGEHLKKQEFVRVEAFLKSMNYEQISISNFKIGEFPRAIMYLEDLSRSTPASLSQHLPLLSKMYSLYGDLDSVYGATTLLTKAPSLEDMLLSHKVSGQLEETRVIYERMAQDGLMTPMHIQGMAECFLNLGEPFSAVQCIHAHAEQQPDLVSILSDTMSESLASLGDWSQLSTYLEQKGVRKQYGWGVSLGKILNNLQEEKYDDFFCEINNCRNKVAEAFKQSGLQFGNYQQGYIHAIRLQILNEIEAVNSLLVATKSVEEYTIEYKALMGRWESRILLVKSDASSLQPLLNVRRILLSLIKNRLPYPLTSLIDEQLSKSLVKSAEVARKASCFHQAYNYILSAEHYKIPTCFIEKAQLFWEKGDRDMSLLILSRGIAEFFPDAENMKSLKAGERIEERKICAEAKLLYATYNEKVSNCDPSKNMTNYQDAFSVCQQWEKVQVSLAQCFDRVVSQMEAEDQEGPKACELRVCMVHHFGKSLTHGCEYIYQTVPRMLSIWLDMGEKINTQDKINAMTKMNRFISSFAERLPPFIFMTALPQLLSRLGHPNREVFLLLKSILVILIKAYPQQCLWAIQLIAKSSIPERVKRYTEVIQDSQLRSSPSLSKLISDFTTLCDKLNRFTNRNPPNDRSRRITVSSFVSELPQLFTSTKFSPIIMPISKFCSMTLPRAKTSHTHEPFPQNVVYIAGIEDEFTVLPSLQKPKKVTFRGSDGELYDILCKGKDDLRRDSRLMEFNNIVNMYLYRDPDSRARELHIRTYAVTPLGESGGLIEWIPNLTGMRPALIKLYKEFGKFTHTSILKKLECNVRDDVHKKREVFLENLLPLHPPVFQEWFRITFPDPSEWYLARQSYIRTTAVMSMVGYILGLGDRHGENILLDTKSGDIFHVDFNVLFNKGERFDWKERVPFRLTHNMVAAMGPLGTEGAFRKSSEISLRVLRSQAKTLMSILTPFAYDPFGSWSKNREIVQNEKDQKIAEALEELADIEKRLNGSIRVKQKNTALYLSVEGQVRSLIAEATSIDNLCQMYIGWSAFL